MKFTWSFPQFVINFSYNDPPNVVAAINWICTGTNGNVSTSLSGTVHLGAPDLSNFVPYSEITYAQAFEWVSQSINTIAVESQIASQISQLSRPINQS